MMPNNPSWYVLAVQAGFAPLVTAGLTKQGRDAFPADFRSSDSSNTSISSVDFVFAQLPSEARGAVSPLPGFRYVAGVPQPLAVPDTDISILRSAIAAGLKMTVVRDTPRLRPGKVIAGSLAGCTGMFIERDGVWQLAIRLKALERTILFALLDQTVEIVEESYR